MGNGTFLRVLVGCGVIGVFTSGCATAGAELSASEPAFAGLDAAVVAEVLGSPAARTNVAGDDPAVAASRYQGMVRNFTACRDALTVYQEWVATGVAPLLPVQPAPDNPAASDKAMKQVIARLEREAASGDISLLRAELTNDSGCGAWIPAEPGNASGPTIADVVNGRG
jgi:hypothetical protein